MQKKVIISGKVDRLHQRKFRVRKHKESEIDAIIEILEDASIDNESYEVEKLSLEGLPEKIDGIPIRWLANFSVKKKGQYINQRYTVTIPGLSSSTSKVVILDSKGNLYYYPDPIVNDTIELTDGDPGTGQAP